ncbi:MAG: tetratricopeptide (TPR) repeat protein [Verrucomicrobiales bacterium]|jgi:tetratricopeptide (TPR) repeat protein
MRKRPTALRLSSALAAVLLWCSLITSWAHLEIEEQIAAVTKELAEKPDDPALYLRRAELNRVHKNWKLASADYDKAEKLDPELTAVSLGRGRMLLDAGEIEKAKFTFDRVLEEKPNEAQAFFFRGRTLAKLGRAREAVRDFDSALPLLRRPTAEHYLERARTLIATKEKEAPTEAVHGLDQGISRLGPLHTLHRYAAEIEIASGETDKALSRIDGMIVKTSGHLEWLKMKADVLIVASKTKEAKHAYQMCLKKIESLPPHRRKVPLIATLKAEIELALSKLK